MNPALSCSGLGKTYATTAGPVTALNDVDLEIRDGEFAAIVGPSGSGKTTLLSLLGGLERPSSGGIPWYRESPCNASSVTIATIGGSRWASYFRRTTWCHISPPSRMWCCRWSSPGRLDAGAAISHPSCSPLWVSQRSGSATALCASAAANSSG